MSISENYTALRDEIPDDVTIVAAAKTRTAEEVAELIDAGVRDIGGNYVRETERIRAELGPKAATVRWHLIGRLQTNKINKALPLFDMIQTVDSVKLARGIAKRTDSAVPILIEINSGREPQKSGVIPEEAERVVREIAAIETVSVQGLMTMGPRFGNPEEARLYFRETRQLFDHLASMAIPEVAMEVLSMGMSNAYRIAVEEGSTMIRPGTVLFGERE